MKRVAPLIMIAALLGAFAFWWYSPTQILKRRTETLLRTLTLEPDAGKAVRQMGVYSLSSLLADEVEMVSGSIQEANGTFPRSEMESTYAFFCEHARECRFDLIKYESVKIDGSAADVVFSMKALVEVPGGGSVDGIYQVVLRWQHGNAGWLIHRAELHEEK